VPKVVTAVFFPFTAFDTSSFERLLYDPGTAFQEGNERVELSFVYSFKWLTTLNHFADLEGNGEEDSKNEIES
jgi:hypothetical protein